MSRGKQMLGTNVEGIEYNFVAHAGRLYMERGCCCDMTDCINFFRRIDPDVSFIRTIAGIVDDTSYRRLADGQWQALDHEGAPWDPCHIDPEEPTVAERFSRAGIEL
jgi:hypothetical protein